MSSYQNLVALKKVLRVSFQMCKSFNSGSMSQNLQEIKLLISVRSLENEI